MAEERGIVKYKATDGNDVTLSFDTIKRYLVQGHPEYVTQQEMMFFMGICKSRALNPFNKDCYLMKYSPKDNAAIIESIQNKRSRAKSQPDCTGWQSGIIVERNGELVYSKGIMLEDDILLGGWFKAKPEGWTVSCEHEVNLEGYVKKTKDGKITQFWKEEKQPMMIEKVAESQGLERCWPKQFSHMYAPEEMGVAESFKQAETIVGEAKTKEDVLTEEILNEQPETTRMAVDVDLEITEEEKLAQAEALRKEKAEAEQNNKEENIPEKPNMIEWLSVARPSTSLTNAKEWLRQYNENEETIDFLADRKLRNQLYKKKEKTEQYIKDNQPPEEPPMSPGTQEQEQRKEEMRKWCQEANEAAERDVTQEGVEELEYKSFDDVPVIEYGLLKTAINRRVG